MTRLARPTGLIRVTSHEAIRTGHASWLTARVKAYAAIWLVLLAAAATLVAARPDLDVLILRQPGTLYAEAEDGAIANFYTVQVINRTSRAHSLSYVVQSPAGGIIEPLGPIGEAAPFGLIESRLLLKVPRERLTGASTALRIDVLVDGSPLETIESSLIGPGAAGAGGSR